MENNEDSQKENAANLVIPKKQEKTFEKKVVITSLITFISLLVVFYMIYKINLFSSIPDFKIKYGSYIFFTILAVVGNTTAIYHLKSYRNAVTCMTGMMIGMTIGMISGLTFGYLVGATNGMFIGAVYGMIVGISTGIWCGKCCGIMGLMEGAMAGLMGGTMGAMLSVMLLADNIMIFTPIFIIACLGILYGLGYLVYNEHKDSDEKLIEPYPLSIFFVVCFIITTITILLMVYGPKSLLLA